MTLFYDEQLSWERKRDKMLQAYAMFLLDYDFAVHRPGIKESRIHDPVRDSLNLPVNN